MGLWGSIKKAAKKVSKAVKDTADKVKDVANDAGNAIGNAIESIADNVFEPGTFLHGLAKGALGLVSTIVRASFEVLGTSISTLIKVVGGSIVLDFGLVLEGVIDTFSTLIGVVILIFLDVVHLLQSPFFGQGRGLNQKELTILRRIYHETLNYDVIFIVQRRGLLGGSRPFVKGNTIYLYEGYMEDGTMSEYDEGTIVHESVHVWQYQNQGLNYVTRAVFAQVFYQSPYSWSREISLGKEDWEEFNFESQAAFIEDLHLYGRQFDQHSETHGEYPPGYDFRGSFFVESKEYDPIFAYTEGAEDPWVTPTPSDVNGWQTTEWAKINRQTHIGLDAMDTLRE